jgi:hypothetical protein
VAVPWSERQIVKLSFLDRVGIAAKAIGEQAAMNDDTWAEMPEDDREFWTACALAAVGALDAALAQQAQPLCEHGETKPHRIENAVPGRWVNTSDYCRGPEQAQAEMPTRHGMLAAECDRRVHKVLKRYFFNREEIGIDALSAEITRALIDPLQDSQ